MVFSSLLFLLCFLPLCLGVYYVAPHFVKSTDDGHKLKNSILLVFSFIFYAFGGVKYLALMMFVIFINWAGGFSVHKGRHKNGARTFFLVLILLADIGVLFFFKYFNLFTAVLENLLYPELAKGGRMVNIWTITGNGALGWPEVVLPIGISFYTFQAMSYVIDVYKSEADLQTDIFNFALYISYFPQLIAGPIVQYRDIEKQLSMRQETVDRFTSGIMRFCYGLAKKVLIANTLGEMVDTIWKLDITKIGATTAWLGAIGYSFQIYYDFSGYSDMAIGLGKMFGFEFKDNFNYPYQAEGISDFWRRWHISLSSWFKQYVYIPLGGNRGSQFATFRNLFIVFLLTGIWHGANWTFFIWGLSYGILIILEKAFLKDFLEKFRFKTLIRLVTFVIVTILWIVFRADNILLAGTFISKLFMKGSEHINALSFLSGKRVLTLVAAVLCGGVIQKLPISKNSRFLKFLSGIFTLVLFVISVIFLVNSTYNPFIYFQF
ncbi:alginate O-acetyltransferase complex protein AlgI [Lachnospiraceae bacterium YSD2013]|nr:alginate O-acetyltransferase complex protein AlgI [Lachnospiraceae bacterium YSD2013]